MRRGEVLALVQAGGQGSRMDVLTRERAKPVLPFAGVHRLIDFPMSALLHAGIEDVWVSVQYLSSSMDTYLSGGRPWDLDRTRGGYRRLVPQTGSGPATEQGFAFGNADLLVRIGNDLEMAGASTLVVSSADHVFNEDLRTVIEEHLSSGAAATLLTKEVTKKEAAHNVVVTADDSGKVSGFQEKPASPPHGVVATEIILYEIGPLMEVLRDLRHRYVAQAEGDDTGLGDFGQYLLPELLDRHELRVSPVAGYWRDVGRPEGYLQAHRDLLRGSVDVFDHDLRPVLANWQDRIPARFRNGSVVEESLVSSGCEVSGEVVGSVLGCGVVVGKGARVTDSVIFDDVVIEAGAQVSSAVVDEGSVLAQGSSVGEVAGGRVASNDQITLVGKGSRVSRRAEVPAGARLEPGTRA